MALSGSVGQLIGLVTKFIASSHNLPIVHWSGEKWIQLWCPSKYNVNPWYGLKYQAATLFLASYEITITTCNSVLLCLCGIDNSQAVQPRITPGASGGKKWGCGAYQTCRFWHCFESSKSTSSWASHGWFLPMAQGQLCPSLSPRAGPCFCWLGLITLS